MTELEEKLVECFDEMAVFKDLKQSNFFSDLKLPSFLRDWVLKKFEDSEGHFCRIKMNGRTLRTVS